MRKFTDEQIIAAVGDGGRVHHILSRLAYGMDNQSDRPAMYRRLLKLELLGKVRRCPQSSYINSIFWVQAKSPPATQIDGCPECQDSGYLESIGGGIWTGENVTSRREICDCLCGQDVRRNALAALRSRAAQGEGE